MALNDTGVYKLKDGGWGFRYTISVDNRRKDVKRVRDANGNPMRTKRDAILARAEAIKNDEDQTPKAKPISRKTVKAVYTEFCENGRTDRAYQTKRKQDSLWENHLCAKFGKQYVDEISPADVMDYLSELYYVEGFSYQYTESFLKMFYLIFGQAYSRNYLSVDAYNKLCVNKDTKIKMPKMKTEDDTAKMFKNVPISCFLNTFTTIIQTSTSQTSTRAIFRRKNRTNFHINFHLSHLRHRRGRQKSGEGISLSSLKKPVLTRFCSLAEIPVQQTLEGLAVTGFVTSI